MSWCLQSNLAHPDPNYQETSLSGRILAGTDIFHCVYPRIRKFTLSYPDNSFGTKWPIHLQKYNQRVSLKAEIMVRMTDTHDQT